MDNLENLDNKKLRAMCLEHGLPDVPITDTSKKLLIRRLRVALEKKESEGGKQEKQQKIQDEIPEKRARERSKSRKSESVVVSSTITIPSGDVIGKVTVTQPQIQAQSRVTPDRHSEFKSSTETKSMRYSTGITKNVQPRNMGKVTENFVLIEDDEDEFDFRPKKSVQSKSKSSLSASPVVTTTYTRNSVERIIEDEDGKVKEDVLEPKRFGIERKNVYNYDYETYKPYTSPLVEGLLTKPESNMGLHQRQARSEIFSINRLPTAATKITASRLSEGYNNESDNDEKESPYLSEFARKLSRLKAEPFSGGRTTEERLSYQRELSLKPRRKLDVRSTKQDSIGEYLRQLYLALDYKYGLRSKFFIALIILVLFCVYAFFF